MSLNTLLLSDEIIKDRTSVHGNVDPKFIYPDIKVAQDMYILPILGTALFDKLLSLLPTDININENINYKKLLDNYIIDALMYYTLAELPTTLSYQLWNKGVVRKQGENTDLPSMSELVDISNKYRERAQYYAKRLRLYLIHESGVNNKFPEYIQPGSSVDTVNPSVNDYSISVYLGGDDCNPYCNTGGFTPKPYTE
jgi:hypothetical protein